MDAKIQKKIEELTVSVEQRRARYRRAMVFTAVVYAILVVFVLGYTSFLHSQIVALATPDNLSQFLVNSAREQLPVIRKDAREQMKPAAAAVAREVVAGGVGMIPNAGTYVRASIDEQVDGILDEFEKQDMPVIEAALDEAVAEVLAKDNAMDPDVLSQEITKRVSCKIGEELDKIINADFYSSVDQLSGKLEKLRAKDSRDLNSREFAEREFIFSWLRLNDIAETGESETSLLSALSEVTWTVSSSMKEEAGE